MRTPPKLSESVVFSLFLILFIILFISSIADKPSSFTLSPVIIFLRLTLAKGTFHFSQYSDADLTAFLKMSSDFRSIIPLSPSRSSFAWIKSTLGSCKCFVTPCTDDKIGHQNFKRETNVNCCNEWRSKWASDFVSLENLPPSKCLRQNIISSKFSWMTSTAL